VQVRGGDRYRRSCEPDHVSCLTNHNSERKRNIRRVVTWSCSRTKTLLGLVVWRHI